MTRLRGRGVSPGIAVGRAVVSLGDARQVRYRLAASGVDRERQRLRAARERTKRDLEEISGWVSRTVGSTQASIFAAQLLMLEDPLLVRRADELVRKERINADWALERVIGELREMFAREGEVLLRDPLENLADVVGRLQRNLRPGPDILADAGHELEPPLILVADELPPSVAAQIDWSRVRGLICDVGSPTHHSVILVRSMGVPAVVGLGAGTTVIMPGQTVAVDGTTGEVAVEPSEEALETWRQRTEIAAAAHAALEELRDRPAATADGLRVTLQANLEIAGEVGRVTEAGAEGVGLYRSEFLLDVMDAEGASEEVQCGVYRGLLEAMRPRPVTVRTFDAGEDRLPTPAPGTRARERFGLRGIRAALHHDVRFRTQVRALFRAADAGALRILLPFVTTPEELRQARSLVEAIRAEVGAPAVPIGAMIEVPAAALMADELATEADFLSVGTNDLIQYTLAVDRTDLRLVGHYQPGAPAILRLLRTVAAAGRRAGCDVAVCGEMAADPLLVALLVGLGFATFSMTPAAIPVVKRSLATLDSRAARRIARRALTAGSADEVQALLAPVAAAIHRAAVGEPGAAVTNAQEE